MAELMRSLPRKIWYPNDRISHAVMAGGVFTTIPTLATEADFFFGPNFLPPQVPLTFCAMTMANVALAVTVQARLNRLEQITPHLSVRQVRADENITLSDGTRIQEDSTIGELHFTVPRSERKTIRQASPVKRLGYLLANATTGLDALANKIAAQDSGIEEIVAFHGLSTLLRPAVLKRLHIPEASHTAVEDGVTFGTRVVHRLNLLQMYRGHPPAHQTWHEVWLTPEQIVAANASN